MRLESAASHLLPALQGKGSKSLAGSGLRHAHCAEVLETAPALCLIEVQAENFFADGGAALQVLQVLQAARELYEFGLHGVALVSCSAAGIDVDHLEKMARRVDRTAPHLHG